MGAGLFPSALIPLSVEKRPGYAISPLRPAWPKPTFRTLTVTTSEWPLGDARNGRLDGMSLGNGGVYNYTHIYI